MNGNDSPLKLKDTNVPSGEQNNNRNDKSAGEKSDFQSMATLWLTKEERLKVEAIIEKLTPYIREAKEVEIEDSWSELVEILTSRKERGKPRTSFFPGEIIEKVKRTVRQKGAPNFGNIFYYFKLRVDGADKRVIDFWAFSDTLDDTEKDWPRIEAITLGERYEFEAEKWNKYDYKVRGLIKLGQKN